jgi:hypothetical protein
MNKSSYVFVVGVLLILFAWGANAQTPQYYNSNTGTSSNSFPFNTAAGKAVNSIFLPGEFNQPSPLPPGQKITTVYIRTSTAGTRTFTNLHILMAQDVITTLTTGQFYPGPYDTVYSNAAPTFTCTVDGWMAITLDRPFNYDPTKSLITFMGQCGTTGSGMSVRNTTLTPVRRTWSIGGCPFVPFATGGDGAMLNFGVDVVPAAPPGWSAETSGVATALNSVKAVNNSVVWVAGNGGVVLRSTNGGTAWTSVGGGAIGTQDLNAIDAISATTAFVTGTPSTITYMFRTTNGGTSWDTVMTQAGGFLDAIKMYDANNGLALGDPVGGRWVIMRTSNGGGTWVRDTLAPLQVSGEAGSNNGLETRGTTHIWFASNSTPPKIYRSTNGGATWTSSNLPGTATFTAALSFVNNQNGVAGGNNGNAARTTDGGATWSSVTVGTTGAIYAAASAGTINFWASRGTTIHKSANLGSTWAQEFSDAAAGTFNHMSFLANSNAAYGWAVTTAGKIYGYYNPVDLHDLGISSLSKLVAASDQPRLPLVPTAYSQSAGQEVDAMAGDPNALDGTSPAMSGLALQPIGNVSFALLDTVRFRAIVKNFGTFPESTYQVGWQVDGVGQTPRNNTRPIPAGANDTLTLQWNLGVNGPHTLRAWTVLASDGNHSNDTVGLNFTVGRAPGDTLYNHNILPTELLLGIAMLPSNKLVITSGGQSNTSTTDNKWIVTTLHGAVLDSSHYQINNTAGQGFGFRDLAWDGRWLLTSDNAQVRRIDTATFTEVLPAFTAPGTLQRGLAAETRNRIWKSNFTTEAVVQFDSTGVQTKTLGVPTVAPYGIAFDKWTSRNRGWLWYSQPSAAGQIRLSKVDTASGAIIATYDYSAGFPTTASSGGLDIVNNHPEYPGAVVAFMVTQLGPGGIITAIYLGADSTLVGVDENNTNIPQAFALMQNYPNPFNPTTTIKYNLPIQSEVTLKVYSVLGQEVATIARGQQGPGNFEATWDGRNAAGMAVGTGVYFYKLDAKATASGETFTSIKKMLLLK